MSLFAKIELECPHCGKSTYAILPDSGSERGEDPEITCEQCKQVFNFSRGMFYTPIGYVSSAEAEEALQRENVTPKKEKGIESTKSAAVKWKIVLSILVVLVLVGMGVIFGRKTSKPEIPGVDIPLKIGSTTVQVDKIEMDKTFEDNGQIINAHNGMNLVFVSPKNGAFDVDTALDIMNGKWSIEDKEGNRYPSRGLLNGKIIFEVPEDAQISLLLIGENGRIPLGSFLDK